MPTLSRRAPALLRTVKGKPHASDDDHEDGSSKKRLNGRPSTPFSSNSPRTSSTFLKPTVLADEDVYADPVSSDDEGPASFQQPQQLTPPASQCKPDDSGFKRPTQLDGPQPIASTPKFKVSGVCSPSSETANKGGSITAPDHVGSDSDDAVFSWPSSQPKRLRLNEPTSNLHALPRARNVQYGKSTRRSQVRPEGKRSAPSGFKRIEQKNEKLREDGATFKRIDLPPDVFAFGEGGNFKRPSEGGEDAHDAWDKVDSSSLSSADGTPPPEEIADLDLPGVVPVAREIECTVCGASVPYSVKEDFEDEYHLQAAAYNYRWHHRFCQFHKQREGRVLWQQRRYPQIGWDALPKRLAKPRHMRHVTGIVKGGASGFRDKWEQRLRAEGVQSARQLATSEDNTTRAGYYGPRGERIMSEHILATFADDLRTLTANNLLFVAAGASSGVAGFVQNVLVPELALSLIREDLGKKHGKAEDVLVESAELGELLHPERDDERSGYSE